MHHNRSQLKKWTLLAGMFAVVAAAPSIALAQNTGFYAGGAFGQAKAKDFKTFCEGATVCDDKDSAWKILGGYQINKNFGAELGYVNLGKVRAAEAPESFSAKSKGLELLGVGTIPLVDKLSAYGKLGFFRWDVDASATDGVNSASASAKGTDLTFGLGVKYDFTKTMGARLEWQRYKDIGNEATTGKSDVDLLSIGIVFKF